MTLRQEILDELVELDVDDLTFDLVLASLEDEQAVEQVLKGTQVDYRAGESNDTNTDIPSVYLHVLTVSGFRGIGPEVKLEFPPGPGLTVVVGRNGSGKSSFAEALEVLLTGNALRWEDRSGPWKEGWRNLHQGTSPKISAGFHVEGKPGTTVVEKKWDENADFAEGIGTAQHRGEKRTDLKGVGWEGPLDLYRPILSYNELGMIGARPSDLFDTLTAVLGLEPLDVATKTLSQARLRREKLGKQVRKELRESILPALANLNDERAEQASALLRKRKWDLDALVRLGTAPEPGREALSKLVALTVPAEERILGVATRLETAHEELSKLQSTDIEDDERLMGLLNIALEHHQTHEGDFCPVCGVGVLDTGWRISAESQVDRLRVSTGRYKAAKRDLELAMKEAAGLVMMPSIPEVPSVDTSSLRGSWSRWAELPEHPGEIANHLISLYEEVAGKAREVGEQAAEMHSKQEEQWLAIFPALMAWQRGARDVEASREPVKSIKNAEKALKEVAVSLRAARWAPIESKALDLWEQLRLRSNVNLRSVELAGIRTRRHVDLRVEVDGAEAQALAVASQGEISCLSLALFFPRATLDGSPFRFLVIDDPIQAMDPARVDGLARVFAEIASDRQLVVFTHDDRLPESLRRLQISHTCLQVTRRTGSVVEVREKQDPVTQYFRDARAMAKDSGLPEELARRVIPGICREGLEAACIEAVRRRRLGRGESHSSVDALLGRARTLSQKASLALFDDIDRIGDLLRRINNKWGRWAGDAYMNANRGAHKQFPGHLMGFINDCVSLAERIRRA